MYMVCMLWQGVGDLEHCVDNVLLLVQNPSSAELDSFDTTNFGDGIVGTIYKMIPGIHFGFWFDRWL